MYKYIFLLASLFLVQSAIAIDEDELLPVDEAFAAEISEVTNGEFKLKFKIADKYYLYKHAFKFPNEDNPVWFEQAIIPAGKKKVDEFFGEVETYRHEVEITIPYQNGNLVESTDFTFKYQGCADAGICYPPQKKTLKVTFPMSADAGLGASNALSKNPDDLLGNNNWAGQMDSVLTEEQAFLVETIAMDDDSLSTRFSIQPNIYLYKDKVQIKSLTEGITIKNWSFPAAQIKDDPHFGQVEVYFNEVEIDVEINRIKTDVLKLDLQVDFQGCVDEGICYPPAMRLIEVDLPKMKTINQASVTSNLSEQDQIQKDLEDNSWWKTILKFFGFGLLLALTPCIFPMIPILSGLIVGQGEITRSRAFMLSLIYVLAMALAYTAAGVIAGLLGANIQAAFQKPWIIILFSSIFVLLSLSMFGYYELQLPASWQSKLSNLSNKQKSGSYIGVGIMGFLSAIIVGPCVAPPLAGAVLYISNTGDPVVGGFALFAMSLGMGVPLLMIGASAGQWMPQSGGWMNVVKAFFGIALIAMAIWFLSRIIPGPVALLLYGILALLSSVFWFRYAVKNGVKGKALGGLFIIKLALMVIGALQVYGAIKGHSDPLHPLRKYDHFEFTKIKSYDDLQKAIVASDKPVLLDFYADWCVECIHMEKTTYVDSAVKIELQRFLVLKADVTAQDDLDKELMKKFKIIGPPATLFFSKDNKILPSHNFFGYKAAKEFIQHLQAIKE
jgi:thiol:disulfide interchange protein DsbD